MDLAHHDRYVPQSGKRAEHFQFAALHVELQQVALRDPGPSAGIVASVTHGTSRAHHRAPFSDSTRRRIEAADAQAMARGELQRYLRVAERCSAIRSQKGDVPGRIEALPPASASAGP